MKTFLILTFLILGKFTVGQKKQIEPIHQIPSVSLYNLKGDTTDLLNLSKDKVTFIDFWFIPCGPCFAEMRLLHKIYAQYKDNGNVNFVTITLTDSAFVRPLTENRNTDSNETYSYFKNLSGLDTFRLPVYFMKNVVKKEKTFVKSDKGFSGKGEAFTKNTSQYPESVFRFSGYPTILIFNRKGKLVYNKTGFTENNEEQQKRTIQTVLEENM